MMDTLRAVPSLSIRQSLLRSSSGCVEQWGAKASAVFGASSTLWRTGRVILSVTAAAGGMRGSAANANTALAGEFLGILAGPSPSEVESGLRAARQMIEKEACFYSANDSGSIVYYARCISRTGSYLSGACGIPAGSPLAYLIAPPLESIYALDQAMKAARVDMCAFYGPPSPTNFGGALLTGSQSDCEAACEAFARAVIEIARNPIEGLFTL